MRVPIEKCLKKTCFTVEIGLFETLVTEGLFYPLIIIERLPNTFDVTRIRFKSVAIAQTT
jgi:hypothetical protein